MSKVIQALTVCLLFAGILALVEVANAVREIGYQEIALKQLTYDAKAKLDASPNAIAKLDELIAHVSRDEEVMTWKINGDGGSPANPHSGPYDGILTQLYKNEKIAHKALFDASQEQLTFFQTLNRESPVLIGKIHMGLDLTNDDLRTLGEVIKRSGVTIDQLNADMKALAEVIGDPEIKVAIEHIAGTAKNTDDATRSIALALADIQGKIHQETHPSKKQKALSALFTTLKIAYYLSFLKP